MQPINRKQTGRKTEGFALLEVLLGLLILGTGLLGLLLANVSVQKFSDAGYERVVATQDAHRVLELIRNASATGNFPANVTAAYPNGSIVPGFNSLIGEQVAVTYANPVADPLDITVATSWQEGGRRNTSIQLRTLMTQRG